MPDIAIGIHAFSLVVSRLFRVYVRVGSLREFPQSRFASTKRARLQFLTQLNFSHRIPPSCSGMLLADKAHRSICIALSVACRHYQHGRSSVVLRHTQNRTLR